MSTSNKPARRRAIARIIRHAGTQEAVAERLGISQAQVSKWLLRRSDIAPHQAVAIEKAFPGVVTRAELRPDLWG